MLDVPEGIDPLTVKDPITKHDCGCGDKPCDSHAEIVAFMREFDGLFGEQRARTTIKLTSDLIIALRNELSETRKRRWRAIIAAFLVNALSQREMSEITGIAANVISKRVRYSRQGWPPGAGSGM